MKVLIIVQFHFYAEERCMCNALFFGAFIHSKILFLVTTALEDAVGSMKESASK